MENTPLPAICPHCQNLVPQESLFCPHCGKALKEAPLLTSVGKQALIYSVSFFLAPMGLWWGIKYLKQSDGSAKRIGLISVGLTLLALALTIYAFSSFMTSLSAQMQNLEINNLNLQSP